MSTKQCEDMLVGKGVRPTGRTDPCLAKIIRTNQPSFPVRIGGGVGDVG